MEKINKEIVQIKQNIKNIKDELTQINVRIKKLEEVEKEYVNLYSILYQKLNLMIEGKKIEKQQKEESTLNVQLKGKAL